MSSEASGSMSCSDSKSRGGSHARDKPQSKSNSKDVASQFNEIVGGGENPLNRSENSVNTSTQELFPTKSSGSKEVPINLGPSTSIKLTPSKGKSFGNQLSISKDFGNQSHMLKARSLPVFASLKSKAFDGVEERFQQVRSIMVTSLRDGSKHMGDGSKLTIDGSKLTIDGSKLMPDGAKTMPEAFKILEAPKQVSEDRTGKIFTKTRILRMRTAELIAARDSENLFNKISIDDATTCTPFSKVRNRWHQRELDGEFASPFCDVNSMSANMNHFLPPTGIREFVQRVGDLVSSESRSFDQMRENGLRGLWVRRLSTQVHCGGDTDDGTKNEAEDDEIVEKKYISVFVEPTGANKYTFSIKARPNLQTSFIRDTDVVSHRVTGDRVTGELAEGVEELLTLPATLIIDMGGSSTKKSWNYHWSEAKIRCSGAQTYMKWSDSLSYTASALIVNGKTNPGTSSFKPKSNEALWTRQVLGAVDIKRVNNTDDAVNEASQNPVCLYPDISELRPARQDLIYSINNSMMWWKPIVLCLLVFHTQAFIPGFGRPQGTFLTRLLFISFASCWQYFFLRTVGTMFQTSLSDEDIYRVIRFYCVRVCIPYVVSMTSYVELTGAKVENQAHYNLVSLVLLVFWLPYFRLARYLFYEEGVTQVALRHPYDICGCENRCHARNKGSISRLSRRLSGTRSGKGSRRIDSTNSSMTSSPLKATTSSPVKATSILPDQDVFGNAKGVVNDTDAVVANLPTSVITSTNPPLRKGRCFSWIYILKKIRPFLGSVGVYFVSAIGLVVPVYVIRADLMIFANHKSQTVQYVRGFVIILGRALSTMVIWYGTSVQNAPHARLHTTATLAMSEGIALPLVVAQCRTFDVFIVLQLINAFVWFYRLVVASPLFESVPIVRVTKAWVMYYKLKPPLGFPEVAFRMYNVEQQSRGATIGCLIVLFLYPFAWSWKRFLAPDERTQTQMVDPNTGIAIMDPDTGRDKTILVPTPPDDLMFSMLYDFFFPNGSLSLLFLSLAFLQELYQDLMMKKLYRRWFGDLYPDFTVFLGYHGHPQTQKTVAMWSSLLPLTVTLMVGTGIVAQMESKGPFAREEK